MTKDEALKLALEALEMNPLDTPTDVYDTKYQKAIDVAKEALAQPAQEHDPWRMAQPKTRTATREEKIVRPAAYETLEERYFCPRCGKRTADSATIHTCTPPRDAVGSQAFYGFPDGPVSTSNVGGNDVTAGETAPTHTLNSTKTVAVATDTYWIPIDKDTPRSAKLQLLSIGGVAQYGTLGSDVSFYTHWCPLPKKAK